ncbi:DNA and RNA helicase [uncultured spirochete]|uniref:DNA 3'-5' helicase n=1 Tax=uncultured spirochete TaxID=156406 RepID=A0A3P3XQ34_9SPIR|nr:DNA and RNA helicase [uncultured spirochete]
MRIIADLHIHSRYSRATSPKLTLSHLDRWARIKGIDLVGTGDCTHPTWLAELMEQLEPAEGGFFQLKSTLRREFDSGEALAEGLPAPSGENPVRFVLTGEISTIYSRDGRTRKVHHVVILPDFAAAAAFQARLERMGNISSDGRPILGVDSRDLFAALLDADERSILVPAHIWTPWFSALGARSGFDSIEECYGDLAPRIGAIETGLSSNPPMNWAVSALDRFAIISNSDAHSPEKLGREATVIDMENSFVGLAGALTGGGPAGRIAGTVEFFPQEGKYHYDGHRACGVVLSPAESAAYGGLCPVCGKPLTPGVMRRVAELADRPVDETASCPPDYAGTNRRPYKSLIPLPELLGELLGVGSGSKKVAAAYGALVERAGSEFALLLDQSEAEIETLGTAGVPGELLAMAVGRMRSGQVSIKPGYDGEYGVIHAFAPGERIGVKAGAGLFDDEVGTGEEETPPPDKAKAGTPAASEPAGGKKRATPPAASDKAPKAVPESGTAAFGLDPAQEAAVNHPGGPALIVAGPGTGKTTVLALRIARLVEGGLDPSSILAITFTNKAAAELRGRIEGTIGGERAARLTTATFHSFCLSVLREHTADASLLSSFGVLDEEEKTAFLKLAVGPSEGRAGAGDAQMDSTHAVPMQARPQKIRRLASYIEERKRFLLLPGDRVPRLGPGAPGGLAELAAELGVPPLDVDLDVAYARYRDELKRAHALDFDDLVAGAARLLAARPEILSAYRARFRAIFVDEYQDVNFAQYALLRLLAPGTPAAPGTLGPRGSISTELCVIGDPNQAIYGFRGSDRRFIERFLADYPGTAIYRLVRSFRCAPGIIGAAGRLVGAELGGSGTVVALSRCEFPTDASEAEGIAREIDRLIGGTRFFAIDSGVVGSVGAGSGAGLAEAHTASREGPVLSSLGECAILVRAAALAPPIEKALRDHGIPYRFIGEKPWWEEEPARSILSLVRAAARTDVRVDVSSAGNLKEAAGATVDIVAGPHCGSPNTPQGQAPVGEALRALLLGLSPAEAVSAAIELLDVEADAGASKAVAAGVPREAFGTRPGKSLERLVSQASLYPDLASFLDDLALGSPQDGYEAHRENVSLMTMHAAKGLEFDYVFVAGLEEGILPFTLFEGRGAGAGDRKGETSEEGGDRSGRATGQDNALLRERIEEERRLLYVAMTRARVGLYLSWARSRHFFGRKLTLAPSRFLAQIEDLVPMVERAAPKKPKDSQLTLF